jgi:hypothetical protein
MAKLFFQLYQPCGLFNQLTSIELAVGLSKKYSRDLIIHNISNPPNSYYGGARVPIYSANYMYSKRDNRVDKYIFPKITDFVDWDGKESVEFIDDTVEFFEEDEIVIDNLMEYYSSDIEDDFFAEGRKLLSFDNYSNYHLKKTLGYYSRFFMNRDLDLNMALSSVRFKQEYYDLSDQIAKSLGYFVGAHFRLADHKNYFSPGTETLDSGISTLQSGMPIVMCTDESSSDIIRGSDYNYIYLDEYILDNFYNEFRQLKFKEEVSFGILNNLVMHHSKDFIGSPGSTYTGYIHRAINQNNNSYIWKIFNEPNFIDGNPYSWNGYDSRDTITKQWWREWKESELWNK